MPLVETMGIRFTKEESDCTEAVFSITDEWRQPYGFLHGGATISLLETVASRAAELRADPDTELPFGVTVEVRHHKSGRDGDVLGVAELDHEEPCRGGTKQFWNVAAYDDEGDIMSGGVIMTKVVSKAYLEQRQAEHEAASEVQAKE
ncbi:PaaI family thioesterase [Adlercreutzia sp. ZJ141]|uniref:PaaI family thioesterase n=1 Tax=Adlercreutzia sp. ZJ141 TaxID=2709406 RepID=UPI0013ECC7B9|nr:PaaI family thioesterase [Adlercreutzia sp. ZJ141]